MWGQSDPTKLYRATITVRGVVTTRTYDDANDALDWIRDSRYETYPSLADNESIYEVFTCDVEEVDR